MPALLIGVQEEGSGGSEYRHQNENTLILSKSE
jgi:hypothetical protein